LIELKMPKVFRRPSLKRYPLCLGGGAVIGRLANIGFICWGITELFCVSYGQEGYI
jgi:hypothetical protein